ncbi:LemA family protein [Nostocoides japonicum T1-X7]|uniref:LemA family protein n=1 Tax=Nostocoides japonicum T1-X7 TaxID=1194083 RepID=A0A077LV36_9MICO|nr:LemA family protein [Tetrasphaera japonica]CCH77788.1 LemA family protein [Tetrasphaera japonica T1-X7]
MIALIIVIVVLVVLALAVVGMYNGLVRLRNKVDEAWNQIDVELQRRHDLIGNLVETVKGYAAHERGTLEEVVRARGAAMAGGQSPAQQAETEGLLTQALGRLIAVAEAYPDLKANQNFLALQNELSSTEDRIASARRYYNANVRELNTKVDTVPSNIVAGIAHVSKREYFEARGESRDPVRVDFGSSGPAVPPPQSYTGTELPRAQAAEPAPQVEGADGTDPAAPDPGPTTPQGS